MKQLLWNRLVACYVLAMTLAVYPSHSQTAQLPVDTIAQRTDISEIEALLKSTGSDRADWNRLLAKLDSNGEDNLALEVRKVMYVSGLVAEERELLQLVNLYRKRGIPFHAGRILEKEINAGRVRSDLKNLTLLAALYRLSRECELALPVLQKAVEVGGGAQMYYQLGTAHFELQHWIDAENATLTAIDTGLDERERGFAWVLIGKTRFERGDKMGAALAFREARNDEGRSWLSFLGDVRNEWCFEFQSRWLNLENEAKVCRRIHNTGPRGDCTAVTERVEKAKQDYFGNCTPRGAPL